MRTVVPEVEVNLCFVRAKFGMSECGGAALQRQTRISTKDSQSPSMSIHFLSARWEESIAISANLTRIGRRSSRILILIGQLNERCITWLHYLS